jgi:hypothetical protein
MLYQMQVELVALAAVVAAVVAELQAMVVQVAYYYFIKIEVIKWR